MWEIIIKNGPELFEIKAQCSRNRINIDVKLLNDNALNCLKFKALETTRAIRIIAGFSLGRGEGGAENKQF